jgi:predicted heme/steroid binding protein
MKGSRLHSALVLIAAFMISGLLLAQSDLGRISGFVRDPSGATVPNAKVTARNASGLERQVTSNESGYYNITNVPPGLYSLTVEAAGFRKYESTDNKLDPSAALVIDAALTVGGVNETVEVSASAVRLQTESSTVEKLITREQINALELNGRNPVGLASLVTGARGGNLANANPFLTQGPSNFNGSRNPENLITFDGAPATRTRSNGASIGAADVDSTQEVQILTADYAPEYGRTSGAQIRIITKSGTQNFHGAGYEYLRNNDLNANTWSRNANPLNSNPAQPGATPSAPALHYNQFGYNLGGPFYIPNHFNTAKKRVFFYWGEEWIRYHWTESGSSVGSAGLLSVPTVKMRQGDFSELLVPNNGFYTAAKIIKDPSTGAQFVASNVVGTANYSPACNQAACPNVIPVSRLSPAGVGILSDWPVPNLTSFVGGSGNWFAARGHTQHQRKDTAAVDINITENQRLQIRHQQYAYLEYQPLDGNTDRTPKFFNRPNHTNSANYTYAISPTKVNELLASFSLDVVKIPVDAANFFDRTKACAGISVPCGVYNYIFPAGKLEPNRIPTVNLSAFSGLNGGPYPSHSGGPIYDLSDSFTWVKNNHTFKFGGLFERSGENDNDEINVQACNTCTNNQNGQFSFTDGRAGGTGVAVANAALGLYDTYSELGQRAYTLFRANMWEAFAQDSWKMRPKLTVNYGVRYTVVVPYHALQGNMIVFDPAFYTAANAVTVDPTKGLITGAVTTAQRFNGMVIPGSGWPSTAKGILASLGPNSSDYNVLFHGVPNHYSDIKWNNIQPRLGLAYQLGEKSVVRAGLGRFYTRLGVSDSVFLGGNPPFQPNVSLSNGVVDQIGPPTGATLTCTPTGAVSTMGCAPLVITSQARDFQNPEAWTWNATFERELPWKSNISIGYVGRRGLHLQREADINQPTTATIAANPCILAGKCKVDAFRPFLGFGSIRQTNDVASSRYNSLQASWTRRFSGGLQFGASYTLSKSMDNGSNQRDVVPDTYDTSMLWGPSEFDVRHIFILNALYELPFFKGQSGFIAKTLGGWQISGIYQAQTGTPCSVSHATDYAGVGLDSNFGCGVNGQYWVMNGTPSYTKTFGTSGHWICCASNFTAPPAGTFNTQRVRNLFYQPGFWNTNMGLFKSIPITERVGLQFRAEAFNVLNHPNWGGGSGGGVNFDPASSNFGKVTTKGGGTGGGERNLQLSLRMFF